VVPTPSPAQPVRVLGRYALYDQIASGGMATVHIGRLLGPVGFSRMVAIKRLHPQYAREPDFVSMFLDEARLAARIRHPNVVGTLDVVALEGELFLVMEYVQGESLAALMRAMRERGAGVPVPIAVAVIVNVLEGLHAAHEALSDQGEPLDIVHRDVSPQNILVGSDGIARVVDFGVAKAAGRVQSTREGQLKGKLGYMAPEQIGGKATRATDVHAASVVLWEMLTGRRLFHADSELQTFANILAGTGIVPPSKYAPQVSPALNRVVLRGLQPNPGERFGSAREMARALQTAAPVASPSDVGDWVESIAGAHIGSRARKIAAIESSGMLPAAAPSTDSLDAGRLSHPPVSGERLRSEPVARRRSVVLPVATATTLALGAVIGIFLHASGPRAASIAAGTPARAAVAAAMSPQASTPSAQASATGTLPAPVRAPAPPTAADARGSSRSPVNVDDLPPMRDDVPATRPAPRWTPPVQPQPAAAPVPTAAPPRQTAGGGSEFSHVMDSRK